MKKIAVIGAGITGIMAAYYLARAGHQVTVFEQERYAAMRTSYANGGQISVSNSEVWTTWSNVRKGISWMLRKDASLLIRPRPDLDKLVWLSKFLLETIGNNYAKNTTETIRLGLSSRNLYQDIIKNENIEFDFSQCGILHFYRNKKYFENAQLVQELYRASGCECDILNPDSTKKLDPALENLSDVLGGAWTATDSVGDIHKFCQQLQQVLEIRYQVKFNFDHEIDKTELNNLIARNDYVIISAGIGSTKLAQYIGNRLDIYPVKGYSITINVRPDQMDLVPKISLLDDEAKIVSSTLGNRFRVAGTAELAGENYDIRRDRIEPLLNWVHKNFPQLDTSNYSSWACLRPMTPNMMPIVKVSDKNPKVIYHTGHGHLGWTVSPATAMQMLNFI
jgi:D-amino-acid dehydrogenase